MECLTCLWTSLDLRPVQVAKYIALIGFGHALRTGLKAIRRRYWTRSRLVIIE